MKVRGLVWKIAVGYLVLTLFITGVLGLAFYLLVRSHLVSQTRVTLRQEAEALARVLASQPLEKERLGRLLLQKATLRLADRLINGNYVVVNGQGVVVASDLENRFKPGNQLEDTLLGAFDEEAMRRGETAIWRGKEFMAAAAPVSGSGGKVLVLVRMSSLREIRQDLFIILLRSLGLAIPLSLLAAFYLARHIARPLRLLQERAQQVARREFGRPVELDTGDEMEDLIHDFNLMEQRLAEHDRAQKAFLQNASHELKTPLTNIQGYAEGIKDGVFTGEEVDQGLGVIIKESQRLKGIVEEILYLSRLEAAGEFYSFGQVELVGAIKEVLESLCPCAVERDIRVELDAPGELRLRGDREKLQRLFLNLAGNALRHARSRVEFSIKTFREEGLIRVSCLDDGEGFLPEQLQHVFERFNKGARGSTGLGLAIVKAIAEGHGGRVTARNRPEGGAEVEVLLLLF